MSYYQYHLFVCTNQRDDGEPCCQQFDAHRARAYLKARAAELGIHAAGQTRINSAGCLNRCDKGPVIVIYPDETWYTYIDQDDLEEILQEHLCNGRVVERLKI